MCSPPQPDQRLYRLFLIIGDNVSHKVRNLYKISINNEKKEKFSLRMGALRLPETRLPESQLPE